MRYLKSDPSPKVNVCALCWISLFSKFSWIKTTASGSSYELGVDGEKKFRKTGILLIKMETGHFNW